MNDNVKEPTVHQAGDDPPSKAGLRWWLLVPLAVSLCFLLFVLSSGGLRSAANSPAIGKPAPQYDLVLLSDDLTLDPLESFPDGQVMLVHFWGTWCGPCKLEYPHLSEMANRLQAEERFHFVPVACEYGPDETFAGLWTKTQEYFRSNKIKSIAFADPRGVTRRSAAERLERASLFYPTSILIDDQGKIAGVWEGYTPEAVEQMEQLAKRLIANSSG